MTDTAGSAIFAGTKPYPADGDANGISEKNKASTNDPCYLGNNNGPGSDKI